MEGKAWETSPGTSACRDTVDNIAFLDNSSGNADDEN